MRICLHALDGPFVRLRSRQASRRCPKTSAKSGTPSSAPASWALQLTACQSPFALPLASAADRRYVGANEMLTWDDVVAREVPCAKCKGAFRVHGPIDQAGLAGFSKPGSLFLQSAGSENSPTQIYEAPRACTSTSPSLARPVTNAKRRCHAESSPIVHNAAR